MDPQKEILKYLKNIVNKLVRLDDRMSVIEKKMLLLGRANSEAYQRVEQVVRCLTENQGEVYDTLCESAGIIEVGTFFGEN
jgi:hypothetical protein